MLKFGAEAYVDVIFVLDVGWGWGGGAKELRLLPVSVKHVMTIPHRAVLAYRWAAKSRGGRAHVVI